MNSSFFKSSIILFLIIFILIFFSFFNLVYSDNFSTLDGNSLEFYNFYTNAGFWWPVPNYSTITSYFGYRNKPTAGASTYHSGIDIAAPNRCKRYCFVFWNC